MAGKFDKRFSELLEQLREVEDTRNSEYFQTVWEGEQVDSDALLGWKVKAKHLLITVCGSDSQHIKHFIEAEYSPLPNAYVTVTKMRAVFLAAKEDYEGGYFSSFRRIVEAEVFDSELDQSAELLSCGYLRAAAVVAGVVLETTLRIIASGNDIQIGKLDKMNVDLAKAGVYSKLTQKRITMLADIRNNAAHGSDQFTEKDVVSMIDDVRRFITEQLP